MALSSAARASTQINRCQAAPRMCAGSVLRARRPGGVVLATRGPQAQQAAAVACETSLVTLVDADEYRAACNDGMVLVDHYTTWCGPCKLISPELEKMAREFPGVKFLKFDCGANDKSFSVALGITALPTFHLYHNGVKVGEFVGAKKDKLREFVRFAAKAAGVA